LSQIGATSPGQLIPGGISTVNHVLAKWEHGAL
jgi:hypothetical protein